MCNCLVCLVERKDHWSLLFEENECMVTVNSELYIIMIENFLLPNLGEIDVRVWFQQDGTAAHSTKCNGCFAGKTPRASDLLKAIFLGRHARLI